MTPEYPQWLPSSDFPDLTTSLEGDQYGLYTAYSSNCWVLVRRNKDQNTFHVLERDIPYEHYLFIMQNLPAYLMEILL